MTKHYQTALEYIQLRDTMRLYNSVGIPVPNAMVIALNNADRALKRFARKARA